jgi:hypothetical protein
LPLPRRQYKFHLNDNFTKLYKTQSYQRDIERCFGRGFPVRKVEKRGNLGIEVVVEVVPQQAVDEDRLPLKIVSAAQEEQQD